MPATRPRASFEPISPRFDLKKLVESTPNFSFVDRISCDMIDQQGMAAFEKLVMLHVIVGGKPLVIDGYEDRLDPWTFSPKWLRDNCGDKVENARVLSTQENLPLTMGHYLKNMDKLTNQFFESEGAYRDKKRQRVYLKDIDCPGVWQEKVKEQIPGFLFYMNESAGDIGGPGAVPDPTNAAPGRRLGRGIARAGDLMSSLPPDMRAENLMCYIGHEGTYTPAHREMCASLGQNLMVEASTMVSEDGKPEKPGSSIWFMTESKDRHIVSEYWLSVLGHDIEVENHFAQVVAWKKAPFHVYVVEQKPGDFILIPPLAPHQVWNRGTRTVKVAWNRTTVETLELALNEALPRSRIVCRDEQYKNKAIVYYTLQKYSGLLSLAQQQAARMPPDDARNFLYTGKVKQLQKDFKKLFSLYKQILLSEMFRPDDRDAPRNIEYLPFDSNVTCAYCRGNIFNRFLTCPSCKDLLGHHADGADGDPYDVCMDCYIMGRSCACISNLKWVEQFKWKELQAKYEGWRKLIISLDGGQISEKTPLTLIEERKRYSKKTLAEVCKEQLKRRPFKDIHKPREDSKDDDDEDEEIVVADDGTVKKITTRRSKTWLKNNHPCHVCCHRHPTWKMAFCTTCDRGWCYGSLFRGWDKMPMDIMEDPDWRCPHCLGICFAGACRREGKMQPYEPKGTLLGHDTRKVADARSVEALVDFSVSNLNWLKDDDAVDRSESSRVKRAKAEAQRAKNADPTLDDDEAIEQTQVDYEYSTQQEINIDPALENEQAARRDGEDEEAYMMRRLQQANSALPPPAGIATGAPANSKADGYVPVAPEASMYPQPDTRNAYAYPPYAQPVSVPPVDEENTSGLRPFRKRQREDADGENYEGINMQKHPRAKKPRMSGAGFRSVDLADETAASKAKTETQRQFQKEKERQALDKAKAEGRFIMLQAVLRGKKRVVKLKVPGARLAQLIAQAAAKAALHADEEADAEHDVEEGGPRENGDDEVATPLLKSDVAPPEPINSQEHFQRRQDEGYIITGNTKKAMVPIEKDENYGYIARERLHGGKRIVIPEKRKRKVRYSAKTYDEVDIGSDDEETSGAFTSNHATTLDRRNRPSYLYSRHEGDNETPDELPNNFGRRPRARPSGTLPSSSSAQPSARIKSDSSPSEAPFPRKAGKRPGVRHAATPGLEADEDEVNNVIDAAASGTLIAEGVDNYAANRSAVPSLAPHAPNGASPLTAKRPRGRPRKYPLPDSGQKQREEQNRLAKLHALQTVGGERKDNREAKKSLAKAAPPAIASRTVSMAEALMFPDDDDDDSEDGIDVVPARPSAAAVQV